MTFRWFEFAVELDRGDGIPGILETPFNGFNRFLVTALRGEAVDASSCTDSNNRLVLVVERGSP